MHKKQKNGKKPEYSYVHTHRNAAHGAKDSYPYVHNKRALKDEQIRASIAKKLAEMPKSTRLDPKDVPETFLDIPCVMKEFTVPPLEERKERRHEFESGVRTAFIQHLAKNHSKQLRDAGISPNQIKGMRLGYTPNGFNTHHIIPLHGGGTNDFTNLVLIRRVPYHDMIHNQIINPQIRGIVDGESVTIKIPMCDSKVFVPAAHLLPMEKEAIKAAEEKRKAKIKKKAAKNKKPQNLKKVIKNKRICSLMDRMKARAKER